MIDLCLPAYTSVFLVPLEARSLNKKDNHYMSRARRVKAIREAVGFIAPKKRPTLPCIVTLCRIANSEGLDEHDNLPGSLKPFVDGVATWLGIDDRDPRVTWLYDQERGPSFGVRITVEAEQ
jgi:hypothetical protein